MHSCSRQLAYLVGHVHSNRKAKLDAFMLEGSRRCLLMSCAPALQIQCHGAMGRHNHPGSSTAPATLAVATCTSSSRHSETSRHFGLVATCELRINASHRFVQ